MSAFSFRPLAREDLPLLHRWLSAPHVARWFGGAQTLEEVEREHLPMILGDVSQRAVLALLDGEPVGFFTHERMGNDPGFLRNYREPDPEALNCDVLLGDPALAHRGVGTEMLRAFLQQVLFADPSAQYVLLDPEADNHIAIRSYEKVGFRFARALADDGEGHSAYLLGLHRRDFEHPPAAREPYLRPARAHELPLALAIDDDGEPLYAAHGVHFDPARAEALFAHEREAWAQSAAAHRLLFACTPEGEPVGFVALGYLDARPFVLQLSVLRAHQRQGHGARLLRRAQRWSVREGSLWLTTYEHLPFNAPWYAREGFSPVDESELGPEVRATLALEREGLPHPERRVVLRYEHASDCAL